MRNIIAAAVILAFTLTVKAATVGEEMPNSSTQVVAAATEVPAPAIVIPTDEPIVYVINRVPCVMKTKEEGGAKVHDRIVYKHIGRFRYKKFEGITLTAKLYRGHKWLFFPKKISGPFSERFEGKKPWLWVFEEGKEPVKTDDLSLLYELLKK